MDIAAKIFLVIIFIIIYCIYKILASVILHNKRKKEKVKNSDDVPAKQSDAKDSNEKVKIPDEIIAKQLKSKSSKEKVKTSDDVPAKQSNNKSINVYKEAIAKGEQKQLYLGLGKYHNNSYEGTHNQAVNYGIIFDYGREEGWDVMVRQVTQDYVGMLESQSVNRQELSDLVGLLHYYCIDNYEKTGTEYELPEWKFDDRMISLFLSNYERLKHTDDMSFLIVENDKGKSHFGREVLPLNLSDLLFPGSMVSDFRDVFASRDGKAFVKSIMNFELSKGDDYSDDPYKIQEYPVWQEVFVYFMYAMVKEGLASPDDISATFIDINYDDDNVFKIIKILRECKYFYDEPILREYQILNIDAVISEIKKLALAETFTDSHEVLMRAYDV